MANLSTKEGVENSDYGSELALKGGSGFVRRLTIALSGESPHAFSKRAGIPDSSFRKYTKGTLPGLEHLLAIATTANVTMDWLAAQRGPMRPDEHLNDVRVPVSAGFQDGDDASNFTLVPVLGVSASAGHGLVALTEEITERLAFKTAWLHDLGLSPQHCGFVICSGNSQDPVIKDGALMLVDMRPDQQIRSGNFYIIVLDGDVLVKLVNRRADGTIELISHNPAYPKEIIDGQHLDKLTIPGRVIWAGQKL